jgi:peptidoglycan/xylan/chitin deacetylase (PgdA/CDA1 family)
MYHDVRAGAPDPAVPATAAAYHVTKALFAEHLRAIRASGRQVITASQWAQGRAGDSVVLTFDDGWRGTFEVAVPMLLEAGWRATVYVTRDFIGRDGFATREMIREAARAGIEIGAHGTTHRMLSSCTPEEMRWEFLTCKRDLESIVDGPVEHASQPGGDWSEDIAACAQDAGLRTLGSSRPGVNGASTPRHCLRRVAVKAGTPATAVGRFCRYAVGLEVARWTLLQMPRRLLGMRNYSRLRRLVLDGHRTERKAVFEP